MKITNELLEKYASGLCTPEECRLIEVWLSDPDSEISFPTGDSSVHKEAIWSKIQQNSFERNIQRVNLFSHLLVSRWLVAAMFVLVCGLGYVVYQKRSAAHLSSLQTKLRVVKTRGGEKNHVKLSDGTIIHLNAESELRVPESFNDSVRNVFLSGEAFLEVAKDADHPFIVTTARAKVRVLGTRFNVKDYSDERTTTVVVQEGKVRFSSASTPGNLILTENERGILDPRNGLREDNVYPGRYLAWKDNKLIFSDQKISEIATVLQRWYGVKVILASEKIGAHRFTGEFENQPVTYVVEKLCYVMDLQYKIEDQRITIY